ncbi:MAG: hypothetical protein QG640_38 [Patescibacteria group bacterium]|nr:hypothetical protein [Patescibacteria group bacterium]
MSKSDNDKKAKVRLNLDLSVIDDTVLNENVKLDDAASRVEAIRKALRLHNAVLKLVGKGGTVIFRPKEGADIQVLVI